MDRGFGDTRDASTRLLRRQGPEQRLHACPSNDLCPKCRRAIRLEALSWLRDLSDDVFGERDDAGDDVITLPSPGHLAPGAQRFH